MTIRSFSNFLALVLGETSNHSHRNNTDESAASSSLITPSSDKHTNYQSCSDWKATMDEEHSTMETSASSPRRNNATSLEDEPTMDTPDSSILMEQSFVDDEDDHVPELDSPSAGTVDNHNRATKLTVLPLAVIIFYGVSGGAFGVEETVRSAGPFYTLVGFALMPWIWSVQEALMTAELSAAFPEAAGGVAWVHAAFGDVAGFMTGYLNWLAGATDNAIYPVLFVEYLLQMVGGSSEQLGAFWRFIIFSSISIVLAYTNWRGLSFVGNMSITICCLAISPFVIMTLIGAFQVEPARWFTPPANLTGIGFEFDDDDYVYNPDMAAGDDKSIDYNVFSWTAISSIAWRPYLNNLFWNLNSFDNAASFAADVQDPGRVLPKALGWSVAMVGSCYFIPLLIALGASDAPQQEWVDGYLSVIATDIAGPWLGAWLVFAAGISNIGMFQAELSSDAFQLMGMAERGYLPKILATRSEHGTPTYGLLINTIIIICMTITELDELIEMLNFNYALSLMMEYISFLTLRVRRPDLHRPYRVPLSTTGCIVLFLPTLTATVVVMALASVQTLLFSVAVNLVGLGIYGMHHYRKGSSPTRPNEAFSHDTVVFEVVPTMDASEETDSRMSSSQGEVA